MSVPLPPWLNVQPSDFTSAAMSGGKMGAEIAGQGIERSRIATEAATRMAQIQSSEHIASMEAAARSATASQNFQLEKATMDFEHSMKQQQLGMQKQQLALDVSQASQKFQAQQDYESMVASGMDPITASLRVGPALLGESVGGLGTLRRGMAMDSFKPTEATLPSGEKIFQRSPGQWERANIPKQFQDSTRTVEGKEVFGQEDQSTGEFKPFGSAQVPRDMTDMQRENIKLRLQARRDKLVELNPMIDSQDKPDPKWNAARQKDFLNKKKQIEDIDKQIDKYESGGEAGADGSGATSSGLKYHIVPVD